MASMLSRRKLMIGLIVVVIITVLILSTNTTVVFQATAPLQNTRRLRPSNIHRVGLPVQMPVDFSSSSYASDVQPDDALSTGSLFERTDANISLGEQGMMFRDKETSTEVKDKKTSSPVQYVSNKSRPNSPGTTRILSYIKKLHTELKKEVNTKIAQYNENNKIPFSSLPNGQMWYVFTEIMMSLAYGQRLPRVINIGVKKSGTTALGFFVGQHPQIAHSFGNEIHFFDKPERKAKGMSYYRSKMGFSNVHQLPFEKTPKYFITEDAPKAILKHLPKDIKFLLCVRDPVKRAISEYHHDTELVLRGNRRSELAEAKRRSSEEQGKLFTEKFISPQGYVYSNRTTIHTSIYSKHFKNWLKTFPRDRFLIVDLGNLEGNTYVELKRIEEFLGLDPFFTPGMMYNTKSRGSCLKINGSIKCPGRSTPGFTKKAKLASNVERTMYNFYRPYNQEFARLTGEQFDWMNL